MDNRYQQIAQAILQGQRVRRVTALDGAQIGQVWTNQDLPDVPSKAPFVFDDPQTGTPMLYEELCQQKALLICGGGHVSVPVAQLGKLLGYGVLVVDDRPEFASPERFPQADAVTCAAFSDYLQSFDWQGMPDLSVVIVTRGHAADAVCLRQAVAHDLTYIGMIGSKRKNQAVFDLLRSEGVTDAQLAAVHAPIGLSIGAETPEEIAVAIAAQLIETRRTSANAGLSEAMLTALAEGQTGIMATVVRKRGSAPRGIGARMFFMDNGHKLGTVGGGLAELEVCRLAEQCKQDRQTVLHSFDLANGEAGKSGMICGGQIDVLFEVVE
nr:XdhC/CoxI family protein [uncultured Butyricicoccus sp.]